MAARKRSAAELQEQSGHVLYEIQMLCALAGYIRTGEVDMAVARLAFLGVPVRNAVVESFELHARNLIEFLIDSRSGGRATAGEFTRGRWRRPDDWEALRDLRIEFSERVAHLSWKRSKFTEEQQMVAVVEIFEAIAVHLETFFTHAHPERLEDGFVEKARFSLDPASHKIATPLPGTWKQPPTGGHKGGTATQGISLPFETD